MEFDDAEERALRDFRFLTQKPVMYIANIDEDSIETCEYADPVDDLAAQEDAESVRLCSKLEAEIAQLDDAVERREYLEMVGLSEPGLEKVIRTGYRLLGLHHYFTATPKEVRAWTIPIGSHAPEAAGKIHTDFERGFIRAEVVDFHTYVASGGESGARAAGLLRSEGKEYEVSDGDVIHFLFNT